MAGNESAVSRYTDPNESPHQATRTTRSSAVTFFMSVALVLEVADSNDNRHLPPFQHIPPVKGNDDFPASDARDTDMNLDTSASSFSHCERLWVNLGLVLFLLFIKLLYHEEKKRCLVFKNSYGDRIVLLKFLTVRWINSQDTTNPASRTPGLGTQGVEDKNLTPQADPMTTEHLSWQAWMHTHTHRGKNV